MRFLFILPLILLNVGCATYGQALYSSHGNGVILYHEDTKPVELCKLYFNEDNRYPGTETYWDIESSNSTWFISGTYRIYDGSLRFLNTSCKINYYTFDNTKYVGIKSKNTFYPEGNAIAWFNGSTRSPSLNRY
jgi:hypothetical protein